MNKGVAGSPPGASPEQISMQVSYGQMMDSSPVATCIANYRGQILYMNPAMAELCGVSRPVIGCKKKKRFADLVEDEKTSKGILQALRLNKRLQSVSTALCGRDGQPKPVQVSACLVDGAVPERMMLFHFFPRPEPERTSGVDLGKPAMEGIISKVSRSLIESGNLDVCLKKLGEMMDVSNAYIFQFRDHGTVLDNTHGWRKMPASPQMPRLQGIPSEMMSGWMEKLNNHENIVIDDVSLFDVEDENILPMLEADNAKSLLTVPLHIKSELIGFICLTDEERTRAWSDSEIRFLSAIADTISSHLWRKRAELALEESERIHRQIVENSPIGVIVIGRDELLFANQAAEAILGLSHGESLADKLQSFLSVEENTVLWRQLQARLDHEGVPPRYESMIVTQSGEQRYIDVDVHISQFAGAVAVFAVFVDITERKKNERLLKRRADQLSLLQHVAGVACQSLDLDALLESTLRTVLSVAGATAGAIYLMNEDGTALNLAISEGLEPELVSRIRQVPKQNCKTWQVVESGSPVYGADTEKESDVYPPIKRHGPKSFISFPLHAKGAVLGAMNISGFGKEAPSLLPNEMLTSIGGQIGIAIQNARLYWERARELVDRQQMERVLSESEEKFRKLAEIIPIGVSVAVDKKNFWINHAFASMFGYSREEMLGKGPELIFAPQELEELLKTEEDWLAGRKPTAERYETAAVKKNGERINISVQAEIIKFGEQDAVLVLVEDITKRHLAEASLRESEQRFRGLFEDSPISLWEEDFSAIKRYIDRLRVNGVRNFRDYFKSHPEEVLHCLHLGQIVDVNKATMELYQCTSREDLLGDLSLFSSEETMPAHAESLIAIAEGKTRFEIETVNKTLTGEKIWVKLRWSAAQGYEDCMSKILVSIIDITEIKRTEAAIKESERRYRDTIERSLDGYYSLDRNGRIEYVNSALGEIFDQPRKEIIGKEFFTLLSQELQERFKPLFSRIMGGQSIPWHEEMIKRKDGKEVWIGFNARRVIRDGVVIGAEGFLKDITKEKADENALHASEARYRALFDSIPFEVFGIASDGRFREVNRNFAQIWGNFVGKKARKAIDNPKHAEFMAAMIENALTTKMSVEKEYSLEKGGTNYHYKTILNPVITSDGQVIGLVGINMDVTGQVLAFERIKDLTSRLVEIQEEERSRIALEIHDSLGQYLTALQLEIGAAANAIQSDTERATGLLTAAHKTVEKAIITAQDLCYTLRPPLLDDFGLVSALKDHIDEFISKWGIKVCFSHSAIEGSLSQLEETALFRIAQEALRNVLKHSHATEVTVRLTRENDFINLMICDNGKGFDVSEFFSRGSSGRYGLISMRERTSMLGGTFDIKSAADQGTTVSIMLPTKREG